MLYLLRSFGENGASILKVGYAKDYKFRLFQYRAHNPYIKEVSKREGELVDETLLHYYLHHLGFCELWNEWYKDCPEVIDVFNKSMDEIKKEVWKNRDSIFKSAAMAKAGNCLVIYKDLLDIFGIDEEKDIDRRFSIIGMREKELEQKEKLDSIKEEDLTEVDKILKEFLSIPFFHNRLKYLYSLDMPKEFAEELFTRLLDPDYAKYYWTIPKSRASALKYQKGNLEAEYNKPEETPALINPVEVEEKLIADVKEKIMSEFPIGSRFSKSFIKEKLKEIYSGLGYNKSPKATDLESYFKLKECLISNKTTGKRHPGFEILKKEEED